MSLTLTNKKECNDGGGIVSGTTGAKLQEHNVGSRRKLLTSLDPSLGKQVGENQVQTGFTTASCGKITRNFCIPFGQGHRRLHFTWQHEL